MTTRKLLILDIGLLALGVLLCVSGMRLDAAPPPPDKPVRLESLIERPAPPAYDANTGSYERRIYTPKWPWDVSQDFSGVKPFRTDGASMPGMRTDSQGRVTLGEGSSGSFTGDEMAEWKDAVRRGPVLLTIMGGLAVIAGIVLAVWAKRIALGLAIAGGGGALIAAGILFEAYPWVLLVALVVAVAAGVWWIVDARFAGRAKTTLAAIVTGVQNATQPVTAGSGDAATLTTPAEEVKASIADAAKAAGAETLVRDVVGKAKAAAGVAKAT